MVKRVKKEKTIKQDVSMSKSKSGFMSHILEQPFVFATGLASLIHSTWSLGTMFAGKAPENGDIVAILYWLIPAFLIAFALDVGQVATSSAIRHKGLTFSRGITFIIFALATYFLQWIYIIHHIPALPLGEGITEQWLAFITNLRDVVAIWGIPALLPLSTLLYTFSDKAQLEKEHQAELNAVMKKRRKGFPKKVLDAVDKIKADNVQPNHEGKYETDVLVQYGLTNTNYQSKARKLLADVA